MRAFKSLLVLAPLLAYGYYVIHLLAPRREIAADYQQQLLLCIASALCSVPVLAVHWLYPPHPKFMLLARRKICIRIHIVAGIIEYAAGVAAFLSGESWLAQVMAMVAIVAHVPSAAYQAPIVFGSRIIILPSYLLCIALHFYCAVRLYIEPTSTFWLIQTFLTFSIYAWVRMFYYAFQRWNLFLGWRYSTAVLFAGVLIAPAVLGPLAVIFLISFIAMYVLLYWLVMWPSRDEFLDDIMEHRRGTYRSAKLDRIWRRLRSSARKVGAGDEPRSESEQALEIFQILDTDSDGILEAEEIRRVMLQERVSLKFVDEFVYYLQGQEINFEVFKNYIWSFGILSRLKPSEQPRPNATHEEQAQIVFDQLDLDHSESIAAFELRMLLTEWDLPERDIDDCIKKYGNAEREIDFATFQNKLSPIWKFAYRDVIARPLQSS
jgi:Ca2+-binding EF-hand superfamily protein